MDLQKLNEIKKRYDADKAENEKAQRYALSVTAHH